jgi:hypothetical protein
MLYNAKYTALRSISHEPATTPASVSTCMLRETVRPQIFQSRPLAVDRPHQGQWPPEVAASCTHCGQAFERGAYRNRHGRSGTIHERGRFCSSRCRSAARRASQIARQQNAHAEPRDVRTLLEGPSEPFPAQSAPTPLEPLLLDRSKRLPPGIVADATLPGMYRLVRPDGSLTDMTNLSRAREAIRKSSAFLRTSSPKR